MMRRVRQVFGGFNGNADFMAMRRFWTGMGDCITALHGATVYDVYEVMDGMYKAYTLRETICGLTMGCATE